MLTGAGRTYTWNKDNRLDVVNGPGSAVMAYDYTGIRVKKTGTGGITLYPFTGYEIQGSTVTKHIRLGNEIVASRQGTARLFYHNDHLGGVNVISDINGARVQLNEYDPWGKVSRSEGNTDPNHRFTGQELDVESGIHYYGGRYYDQALGRFVSPDPFVQDPGDPQNLNRYAYVLNSPQIYIDPSGYIPIDEFSGVISAVESAYYDYRAYVSDLPRMHEFVLPPMSASSGGFDVNQMLSNYNLVDSFQNRNSFASLFTSTQSFSFTSSVSPPSALESLVPIWGSSRSAINHFQEGRYGWGMLNAGMAASDVFLVKALVQTTAKVGVQNLAKFGGSHTWDATRKWYRKHFDQSLSPGTQLHHWLFERNRGLGRFVPDWLKNQPWNLMPVTRQFHELIPELNALGVWLHATSAWSKAAQLSIGGRVADGVTDE